MSAICRCIFRSLFTSCTSMPEPEATRRLRLAFISAGFWRSPRVIEEMMASWRGTSLSSRPAAAIWFFILPTPGIMPRMPDMPPIFCIWRS